MYKFFQFLTEAIGWLLIAASPFLMGLVIAACIYFPDPGSTRLVVACLVAAIGLFIGILWATRVWKGKGTMWFLSRIMATPELDGINKEVDRNGQQLEIKSFEPDGLDLHTVNELKNGKPFCILMECEIGEANSPGADLFRFSVCNAAWLAEYVSKEGKPIFLNELSLMVVEEFDLELIKSEFEKKIIKEDNKLAGRISWKNRALRISHYSHWEYFREETSKGT